MSSYSEGLIDPLIEFAQFIVQKRLTNVDGDELAAEAVDQQVGDQP